MEIKTNVVNGLTCAADKVADFTDVVVDKTRLRTKMCCLKDIIKKDKKKRTQIYANLGELYFNKIKNNIEDEQKAKEYIEQIDKIGLRIQKAHDLYDDLYEQYKSVTLKSRNCADKKEMSTNSEINDELDMSVFDKDNFDREYIKATVSKKAKELSEKTKTAAQTAAQKAKDSAQKAKESAGELAQNAKEAIENVSQKTKTAVTELTEKALDKVDGLADKTKEKTQNYRYGIKTAVVVDEGTLDDDALSDTDDAKQESANNKAKNTSDKMSYSSGKPTVKESGEAVDKSEKTNKNTVDESTDTFTF